MDKQLVSLPHDINSSCRTEKCAECDAVEHLNNRQPAANQHAGFWADYLNAEQSADLIGPFFCCPQNCQGRYEDRFSTA